jgi:hypothetical protein
MRIWRIDRAENHRGTASSAKIVTNDDRSIKTQEAEERPKGQKERMIADE